MVTERSLAVKADTGARKDDASAGSASVAQHAKTSASMVSDLGRDTNMCRTKTTIVARVVHVGI